MAPKQTLRKATTSKWSRLVACVVLLMALDQHNWGMAALAAVVMFVFEEDDNERIR